MPFPNYPWPDANWSLIPSYMHEAIGDYVMYGAQPGSFLKAVLENDLFTASVQADEKNLVSFAGWARFLYNYAPSDCKGSPEAYKAWRAHGGLAGRDEWAKVRAKLLATIKTDD